MEQKLFQLLIFQDETLIFYYDPFNHLAPNYSQLQESHRIQNLVGVSKSMNALIKQIYPSQNTTFRNFKTKQYQFNQLDTPNGLKIIAITSIRSDERVQNVLKQVYEAYINYVKKNYLFETGQVVDVKMFKDKITQIVKVLSDK